MAISSGADRSILRVPVAGCENNVIEVYPRRTGRGVLVLKGDVMLRIIQVLGCEQRLLELGRSVVAIASFIFVIKNDQVLVLNNKQKHWR